MAGRHFLSVLGTSNYSKVTYRCDEGTLATEYIQEAVDAERTRFWGR